MATRYKVGDKVSMTDEFLRYDYGTGTIVDVGYYPFPTRICYLVKSDRTGKVWDYPARQLRLIMRGKSRKC